jgi:hypothetical protein
MASGTVAVGSRNTEWLGLLASFAAALPLLWMSDALSRASDSVVLSVLASAAAPFMAGFDPARLRIGLHATLMGIGAATAVLAVSIGDVHTLASNGEGPALLALVLAMVVAASFLIARSGARIGALLAERREARRLAS